MAHPSRQVEERDSALDVSRLGEAHFDAGLGAGERRRRVPRLLVVLAPYRLAVLAKGVLDGLERLARVAEKEFVREDLPNARLCAVPPSVPVLVDERADAGLDARAARELDDVLDVPQRAEEEDVLGPIQLGVFRNLGAPSCNTPRSMAARPPHSSHSVAFWPCASMRASAMAWKRSAFVSLLLSRMKGCGQSP